MDGKVEEEWKVEGEWMGRQKENGWLGRRRMDGKVEEEQMGRQKENG